jgi:hypothetical protein
MPISGKVRSYSGWVGSVTVTVSVGSAVISSGVFSWDRFGLADITTSPEATPPDRLLLGAFDTRTSGILEPERVARLSLPCGLQGFMRLACLQSQQTRLFLHLGAWRAVDTRRAIRAGKAHFPHHTVLRIGVWEPREALLARWASDHLALPIDQELRLVETLPGAGLPAGIVSYRPDDRDGMVTLTVDQHLRVGIPVVRKNSIPVTCPASSAIRPTYTPPGAGCNAALDKGSPSSEISRG